MQITFKDVSAISTDIREPDLIKVKFTLPSFFIDAETGDTLEEGSWEKIIKVSP